MWMALSLVERNFNDTLYFLSVIVSYLLGSAFFRRAAAKDRGSHTRSSSLLRVSALVTAFFFVGSDVVFGTTSSRWSAVIMLAMGFGVVNGVGQEVAGTLTFVVTGHLTRLVNQLVDRVSRRVGRRRMTPEEKEVAVRNASVFVGFFGGALWACFLLKCRSRMVASTFGEATEGLFAIIGLLYGMLFLWHDGDKWGDPWWLRKDRSPCEVDDDGQICP